MSSYKTFAIWGAGNIGSRIAVELLARAPQTGVSVIILTRPTSKDSESNKELAAKGAIIRPYDVTSADPTSALAGVDVLISTTGLHSLHLQSQLLRAAHTSGVKLFVPAEWGDSSDNQELALFKAKVALRQEAAELGVPTVAFQHGLWTEWFEELGWNLKEGKIVMGEGLAPVSTTSINDVARFAAHILTALPPAQLENAKFRIEGDRVVLKTLAEALQKASSKPLEVTHVPRAELERNVKENPAESPSTFMLHWDTGKAALPYPLSNDLWPEWKPKKALEILTPMLA